VRPLQAKAIRIKGYTEGKKGRVVFRTPVLTVKDIDKDTDRAALALDKELQDYFKPPTSSGRSASRWRRPTSTSAERSNPGTATVSGRQLRDMADS
jgi:hypothetical protein